MKVTLICVLTKKHSFINVKTIYGSFCKVALHANNVDIYLEFMSVFDIDTGNWNTSSNKPTVCLS